MTTFLRAIPASLLMVALVVLLSFGSTSKVSAATVLGYGDEAAISDCLSLTDPCVFSGALALGYFNFGPGLVFDHFYASLIGTPGATLNMTLTAAVDTDVSTSGFTGGVPIDMNGGGGSGTYFLEAGITQTLALMFGLDGYLTLNTATLTGAVADPSGLFAESSFAFATDAGTGSFLFGDPNVVGSRSCSSMSTWDGSRCVAIDDGGGGSNPSPVPIPAGILLLGFALLGGFSFSKLRKQK